MQARRSVFLLLLGLAFVAWSIQAVREQRVGGMPWKTGVGAVILLSAAIGGWIVLRKEDQQGSLALNETPREAPPSSAARAPTVQPTDRVLPSGTCAVCGRQLGSGERFCAFDGAEGVLDPGMHRGLICPRCGRGYTDGRTECVEDGAELVAANARSRPSASAKSPKVCPTCGKRRTRGGYCPHDGDRLVVLN